MSELESFSFQNVSPENTQRLRQYIERYGGTVSGETDGTVSNDCFTLAYDYSPTDKLLNVTPQKLDPVITSAALRRSIKRLMDLPDDPVSLVPTTATTDLPTPTNQSCGVYLWIYGFITNKTSVPMSVVGGYDTANCVSISMNSPIAANTTVTSSSPPDFHWKGQKSAFNTGVGKIEYAIGQEKVTLTFQMQDNSPPDGIGVTATVSGTRFTANNTTHSASFDSGAAASDLYIYLQIDNVTPL